MELSLNFCRTYAQGTKNMTLRLLRSGRNDENMLILRKSYSEEKSHLLAPKSTTTELLFMGISQNECPRKDVK